MPQSDYPILGAGITRARKRFFIYMHTTIYLRYIYKQCAVKNSYKD